MDDVDIQRYLDSHLEVLQRVDKEHHEEMQWLFSHLRHEYEDRFSTIHIEIDRRFGQDKSDIEEKVRDAVLTFTQRMDTENEMTHQLDASIRAALATAQETTRQALDTATRQTREALDSAEKSVAKSELNADKRFDSVNEFRAQLADQAATFLVRTEYSTSHSALSDKLDIEIKRLEKTHTEDMQRTVDDFRALELRITSRLDQMAGVQLGAEKLKEEERSGSSVSAQWAAIGITALISLATFIFLVVSHAKP